MARGHDQQMLGYTLDGSQRWLGLTNNAGLTVNSSRVRNGFEISAQFRDPDGAQWQLIQRFTSALDGAIAVQASAVVDQPREVVYLPLITMVPGLGSFGTNKTQGLFCGLEYLDNEPASSEADIIGPESRRQVPDTIKITVPLMAISAMDRYVGLTWEPAPNLAAVFDSPDRLFLSGGHIMGIIFPGSNGENREEGNLMPYKGTLLKANVPLLLRATIIGGAGQSVVPAVQHYVALRGLPPLPSPVLTADEYFPPGGSGLVGLSHPHQCPVPPRLLAGVQRSTRCRRGGFPFLARAIPCQFRFAAPAHGHLRTGHPATLTSRQFQPRVDQSSSLPTPRPALQCRGGKC